MSRTMNFRVAKNERGRWEIQYSYNYRGEPENWAFEYGNDDYATRAEAKAEMEYQIGQSAMDRASERRYQSQTAYACGERE